MHVVVRTIGPFTERLGFHELTVTLKGTTVQDLLDQLCEDHGPTFRETIFNKEGELRRYIKILVNGRGIHVLQGLNSPLSDGDIVAVFPPVSGG